MECKTMISSCCSNFEFDFLVEKYDEKVKKINKIKVLLKDTIRYINNIGINKFEEFKYNLMNKFEEKCQIKHIDLQLSRISLNIGVNDIFKKIDQVFGKRIEIKSAEICDFCNYKFHQRLQLGENTLHISEKTCKRFLKEDAKDYIDLLNILWEIALIREGLNCVSRELNDEEYQIKEKINKRLNLDVSENRQVLENGETKDLTSSDISKMSKSPNKLSLKFDQKYLMEEKGASIIKLNSKYFMNNIENLNLFDKNSLPNLEEQTEINGIISNCNVSLNFNKNNECSSICKEYFNMNTLENQLAYFLQDVIKSVNSYFYTSKKEKKKTIPFGEKKSQAIYWIPIILNL